MTDAVTRIDFQKPETRTVTSLMRNGVFGVKSMQAKLIGKTMEKGEHGTFTTLHVEATWPYTDQIRRMDFVADDSLIMGQVREWRLDRASLKGQPHGE